MSTYPTTNNSNIRVRRAYVDCVELYEVKEHELIQLEKGSDADIFLNFAIFLFSTAFACNLTLVSANFTKPIFQTFAIVVTVIGYLLSLLLIILWFRNRKNINEVIKQIRKRLPVEPILTDDPQAIEIIPVNIDVTVVGNSTTNPVG
jgi:NADH:ubiquinone oxidoreductase subunit K